VGPSVTVAVVSWNTRRLLDACLQSLEPEHQVGPAEVWVIDNGSSDGSPELVRTKFPWVQLVQPAHNLGFGRAVNLVAERTDSEWLAAANADVEVTPGALEALLARGRADPQAGCIAPRLVLPDGSTQHSVYSFPGPPLALATHLGLHRLVPGLGDRLCHPGYWNPGRGRHVDWAVGAFLLLRREAFEQVGGFDPRQWLFAEDLELGWQLDRSGWSRLYEPGAVVRHAESAATATAFSSDRTARTMIATYEWVARRRGLLSALATAGIAWATLSARFVFLRVAARLSPTRFGSRRDRARFWTGIHRAGLATVARGRA
jgi:N-acetylglucosaminyl-diphospho-decaprenol L-rhamnosyltransferase